VELLHGSSYVKAWTFNSPFHAHVFARPSCDDKLFSMQLVSEYVNAARRRLADLNEYMHVTDGLAALYPHVLALVVNRGLSGIGHYNKAKLCVINAFDVDFILSTDKVMNVILHKAQNIDNEASF
jgi:hypothetical protein